MKEGIVIKNTGSWYNVKEENGDIWHCKLKGKLRLTEVKSTNPIAIGDRVTIEIGDGETGSIISLIDRKNYIIRRSSNLSKQSHIIAANLDQVFLILTVNYPITTTTFIDRFLATAEAYRVPAKLIINKMDRYNEKDLEVLSNWENIYSKIGYSIIKISAKNSSNIEELQAKLHNKVSLLSGHSGVGKSTIINKIAPQLQLKTAEISDYHQTGKHTTTYSEMHELEGGGYIIDTPGIKGFGIVNMEKEEIHHFFPEIFKASKECRFNNCCHTHEPGCHVKELVELNEIADSRYFSYLNVLGEFEEGKHRS